VIRASAVRRPTRGRVLHFRRPLHRPRRPFVIERARDVRKYSVMRFLPFDCARGGTARGCGVVSIDELFPLCAMTMVDRRRGARRHRGTPRVRRHIESVRCNALFYGRRAARATKDDARGVGARAAVCVVVTVFDSSSRHTAPRSPPVDASPRARAELDAKPRVRCVAR